MKIKYTPNDFLLKKTSPMYERLFINQEYTVYGILIIENITYFYICASTDDDYSLPLLSTAFSIVDPRPSRFWIFGIRNQNPILFFPEMIQEEYFEDRITDWQQREMDIFKKYKKLMDFEFPDSSITENAQIGDENWLICPTCIAPWEYSSDKDAIVECPTCKKAMNNPRYKDALPHY
jgi:hypothetical protein